MSIPEDFQPLDHTIESEKIDLPMDIKQIIQKYTTWETMEDLEKAREKYYETRSGTSVEDLEKELGIMEKLHSDLEKLERDHYKKSLHDVVEIAKHQIFDKFPGIQNMETYNRLKDEEWIDAILQERTVNDRVEFNDCYCDCMCSNYRFTLATVAYGRVPFRSSHRPVVETDEDVEIRLNELYEELGTNRSKVLEACDLRDTMRSTCWEVQEIVRNLKSEVGCCRYQIRMEEDRCEEERRQKERMDRQEEAKKLMNEKFELLCNVMKEVLGDRVEDVVVSFEYMGSSSCCLKESGMGGMTLEINPENYIIEDLRKRCNADKLDIHVRNATLVLFNYAELSKSSKQF